MKKFLLKLIQIFVKILFLIHTNQRSPSFFGKSRKLITPITAAKFWMAVVFLKKPKIAYCFCKAKDRDLYLKFKTKH